ncbi:MAG: phage portal protein [Clostridiaceae bacterium]|nr:phage portal protein [Clostridiaceae bacterium]
MGLLDLFKRSRFQGGTERMYPRWTTPPDRNSSEWLQSFGENPRLSVVDKIASDLSYIPGKLYRIGEDGERQEVTSHPFLDFMDQPNPLYEMTSSAIWRLQAIFLMLKGEGYFIIERYSDGTPAELWPVPTHWVQMTPYQGNPFYQVRTTDGYMMNVSVDDMFVMRDLKPLDPYRRGLGQAEALADEVETDEYAAKFQKKFFYNDATPGIVISMPGANDDQQTRFLAKWDERLRGPNKSHRPITIGGPPGSPAAVTKLADNMKDMDMINGRTFTRDAVLEHFGVPREIMGITQNSNRATADAAQYIYAKNVLTPKLKNRQDAINRQLLPAYGEDLEWEFDDIIPHDQEFEKAVALDGWNNGLLTKNEAREKLGMEPAKNGDIYKMNFADLFLDETEDPVEVSSASANLQFAEGDPPLDEGRNQIEIDPTDLTDQEEDKILQRAVEIKARRIKAAGRSLEQVRKTQERKFEQSMKRYFKDQADHIRKSLKGTKKAADSDVWDAIGITQEEFQALPKTEQQELTMKFVTGLLNWEEEENILKSILTPLWAETYDKGTENVINTYRIPGINRPELTATARLRGGQRVTKVTKTTKEQIARIVTEGLETGKSHQELSDEIMNEMNTTSARARTIAAQECNTSLQAGSFDMAKRCQFKTKTWHVTNINKARDTHRELNGKTIPFSEPFVTSKGHKLMMPCDPDCNAAEETVNCHCFLTYS